MANDVTQRDLVWAAALKQSGRFETTDLYDELPENRYEQPSHETVKRTLRAGSDLGMISHRNRSTNYRLAKEFNPHRSHDYNRYDVIESIGGVKLQLTEEGGSTSLNGSGTIDLSREGARQLGERLIEAADQ